MYVYYCNFIIFSDTSSWEPCPNYPETDDRDDVIGPRAGSCAAVVGTRMYVWSGRDGYKKVWNSQVGGER